MRLPRCLRGRGRTATLAAALLFGPMHAQANGIGENGSFQFETTQDRVNKGAVLDLVERKKGGYYDSFKTTNYNTTNTYIDKQFNCAVSASSSGNAGTSSVQANTSSPSVTNSGTTSSATNANSASNGISQNGFPGVLVASAGGNPFGSGTGSLGNNQSNSGALNSGVTGSSTNAATGAISAGGGSSDQVLNSTQNNTGAQTATIAGSTACNGPLVSQ